jgi:hypothetical protein
VIEERTVANDNTIAWEEEGTASTFQALGEVIGEHGLFCALYTDRGSHYFYTPKAGEKVSKTQQTQVGRALSHLPKMLRLAGITTVELHVAFRGLSAKGTDRRKTTDRRRT